MAEFVPVSKPRISDVEKEFVVEALDDEWVSPAGDKVEEFEEAFANRVGSEYAATATTGTSALHLCMEALGGESPDGGDRGVVFVPSHTFASTAASPMYAGYDVQFVDVQEEDFGIDPDELRNEVRQTYLDDRNPEAVVATHLFGMPCDLDEISSVADEFDMYVVEDAAEAFGAKYQGEHVGTIGDVGMFSFYGNKNITTGQGGMVVTDNPELNRRVRRLRRFGVVPDHEHYYYHSHAAWNYQMTNIQAAIGLGQLVHATRLLEDRETVAERYRSELQVPTIYPQEKPESEVTAWLSVAQFESHQQRQEVEEALEANDIGSRPTFYPLPLQPPFPSVSDQCATAMELFETCLCLPTYPDLAKEKEKQGRVIETVNEVVA